MRDWASVRVPHMYGQHFNDSTYYYSGGISSSNMAQLPSSVRIDVLRDALPESNYQTRDDINVSSPRNVAVVLAQEYLGKAAYFAIKQQHLVYTPDNDDNSVIPDFIDEDLFGSTHANYTKPSNTSGFSGAIDYFWDVISLLYTVKEDAQTNKINIKYEYDLVDSFEDASYRFDDMPKRTVEKTLPERYSIDHIRGNVKIAGAAGDDTIEMNMRDALGLDVDINQLTINLADYEFDTSIDLQSAGLDREQTITHDDIQSALIQKAKLGEPGLLDRLISGELVDYDVTLTVDSTELSFDLQSTLEALVDINNDGILTSQGTAYTLGNAVVGDVNQTAYVEEVKKTILRGLQSLKLLDDGVAVAADAAFSMDKVLALLNDLELLYMIEGDSPVAAATPVRDDLQNVIDFLTKSSVRSELIDDHGYTINQTYDASNPHLTPLMVYEQNSNNDGDGLNGRTTIYEYSADIAKPSIRSEALTFGARPDLDGATESNPIYADNFIVNTNSGFDGRYKNQTYESYNSNYGNRDTGYWTAGRTNNVARFYWQDWDNWSNPNEGHWDVDSIYWYLYVGGHWNDDIEAIWLWPNSKIEIWLMESGQR